MKKWLSILTILMGVAAFSTTIQAAPFKRTKKTASAPHPHWSYKGEYAPLNWGKIHGNEICAIGSHQTPVDVQGAIAAPAAPDVRFEYTGYSSEVVNNGHSIQVNFLSGSKLYLGSKAYNLVQVHFHTPSEFTIEGKQFPMVAHFVHRSAQGELLVFALMFENGEENPIIQEIWNKMPREVNGRNLLNVINVKDLVAKTTGYYRLDGSLTTPPCSEGVTWIIAKTPAYASQQQFSQFTNVIGINNRPLQPLNGRLIIEK